MADPTARVDVYDDGVTGHVSITVTDASGLAHYYERQWTPPGISTPQVGGMLGLVIAATEVGAVASGLVAETGIIDGVNQNFGRPASKRSNCLSRWSFCIISSVPEHCIEDGEELSCAGC